MPQTTNNLGANAQQNTTTGTALGSPAPATTFDASSLAQPNQNIQFPTNQPSTQTGATSANALNSSIPTASSIISQETQDTPAEDANNTLLGKLATLIGGQSSLATQQTQSENQAGIPNLTKITNDLSTQLMGLNDQSTALQLAAAPGGTLQNQEQNNAQGRGITTGGLAPMTSADLRNNQIQQSSIAAQSLTVKSAYYAANNNLTLAKDAADKAAQVAFDASQQQINYVKALIDANTPQMSKEEQAQADTVKAQLQDRQDQIDQQKTDYTTGIGLINNAMKFNGQSPQAQLAIQAAQKVDPHDPQYLQKVGALLVAYQQDPVATQQALATLANTRANTAKTIADTNIANANLNQGTPDISAGLTPVQQAALKTSGFSSFNNETQGLAQQLATGQIAPSELSKRATGTSPYNSILSAADAYSMATTGKHFSIAQAQRDYQFASNVTTQNTLNYLGSLVGTNDGSGNLVGGNLDALIQQSNERLQSSNTSAFGGTKTNSFGSNQGQSLPALNDISQWTKLEAGNPQIAAYYTTLTEVSDQVAKILQGGTGGTSDAKLQQAQSLFDKGFTPAQITAVAGSLKTLLANRAKSMVGDNPYLSDYATNLGVTNSPDATGGSRTGTLSDGTVVTQNADGSITDAKGNKYDSNGNKL